MIIKILYNHIGDNLDTDKCVSYKMNTVKRASNRLYTDIKQALNIAMY